MRVKMILAVVTMVALLLALVGCNDNDNTPGGANGFTLGGTVTNAVTGTTDANTSVQLVQNGTAVGQPIPAAANGQFSITGVPAGTYTLQTTTTTANGNVTTVTGPITVTNTDLTNLQVRGLTQVQLNVLANVPAPGAATANLVVYAQNSAGQLVAATATVNNQTSGPAVPVVFTNLAPGTFPVTVATTGQADVIIPNVPLTAGATTLVIAQVPNATAATLPVTGVVKNAIADSIVVGATLTLWQNNTQIGSATVTDAQGTFTFLNVPQGVDYLIKVQTANGPISYYGPFSVGITTAPLVVPTVSNTNLKNLGVALPAAGTATLVVFGADANTNVFNATVMVDTNTPVVGTTAPTVVTPLTPGVHTITVTNPTTLQNAVAPGVNLASGAISVLFVQLGQNVQ